MLSLVPGFLALVITIFLSSWLLSWSLYGRRKPSSQDRRRPRSLGRAMAGLPAGVP